MGECPDETILGFTSTPPLIAADISAKMTQNKMIPLAEENIAVDLEHVEEVMGDETSEILHLYLIGMTENLEKLDSAIQTNNINEVDELAHNCAGTSATCGMVAIVPTFRALEKVAREGSLDNAQALLDEAKKQFERICSFLKMELAISQ